MSQQKDEKDTITDTTSASTERPTPHAHERRRPPGISMFALGHDGNLRPLGRPSSPEEANEQQAAERLLSFILGDGPSFPGSPDDLVNPMAPAGSPPPASPFSSFLADVLRRVEERSQGPQGPLNGRLPSSQSNPFAALARALVDGPLENDTLTSFMKVADVYEHCWGCLVSQVPRSDAAMQALFSLTLSKASLLAKLVGIDRERFAFMAGQSFLNV